MDGAAGGWSAAAGPSGRQTLRCLDHTETLVTETLELLIVFVLTRNVSLPVCRLST